MIMGNRQYSMSMLSKKTNTRGDYNTKQRIIHMNQRGETLHSIISY